MSNQNKLQRIICKNSKNKTWKEAKNEWTLLNIFENENECICGHPILENCEIINLITEKTIIVGNCCIRHFGREDLEVEDRVYASLKRLRENPKKSTANEALLAKAVDIGVLTLSEAEFYFKITTGKGARKHFDRYHEDFSIKKYQIRYQKNIMILMGFNQSRPHCPCGLLTKPNVTKTGKFFYGCSKWTPGGGGCGFFQERQDKNIEFLSESESESDSESESENESESDSD